MASTFIKITNKWFINRTQVADIWISKKDNKWNLNISYIVPQKNNDSISIDGDEEEATKFLAEVVDRLNGKIPQTISEDEDE